jgi:hypothetical protein
VDDFVQVPAVLIKQTPHVLKQPQFGLKLLYSGNERWEPISGIIETKLISTNTKGLAWRPSNDNVSRREVGRRSKKLLSATAVKIRCVGCATVSFLFKSNRAKPSSLKTQGQAPASGKQIQNNFGPVYGGLQSPLYIPYVVSSLRSHRFA